MIEHIVETAVETQRKVQATAGLYAPNLLGYTRATMVRTMDTTPKGEVKPRNRTSVQIEDCNSSS